MFFLSKSTNAFAIDLGTNNTLVYQPKRGIILDEPTSIAFDSRRQKFFNCGMTSKAMIGKSPQYIEVMQPLSKGAISNLTVAKAYIKEVIRRIASNRFFKPSIVISVPSDLNTMERNAVIEAGREGGAKSVMLLKDSFSAAIGSEHAIDSPKGILVLDIGAGVSEISLISCNGIVLSKSLRVAGNDMDTLIMEYFKEHKRILISHVDAEMLKKELGALSGTKEEKIIDINVKSMTTRLPETFSASSIDVHQAILPLADKIVTLVHSVISELPPIFAQDIYDNGLIMTGGSSLLPGLDYYLSKKLKMEVNLVSNPLQNIILGAGRAIEESRYTKLLGT